MDCENLKYRKDLVATIAKQMQLAYIKIQDAAKNPEVREKHFSFFSIGSERLE